MSNKNSFIDLFVNNSTVLFIFMVLDFIAFIFSIVNDSLAVKIVALIVLGIILIIFILKFFSSKQIRKHIINEMNEKVMSTIKKINSNYKNIFNSIEDEDENSYTVRNLSNLMKPMMNYIVNLSDVLVTHKSCVCLKMIAIDHYLDDNYNEWKLKTIARSDSTEAIRSKNDDIPVRLIDNTDFYEVIVGTSQSFIAASLPDVVSTLKSQGKTYKNSTNGYKYNSTIVYPILNDMKCVSGIIKKYTSSKTNSKDYHIIGFLCWDSEYEFQSDEELKAFLYLSELLESFANSLYPVLENYINHIIEKRSMLLNGKIKTK